MFGQFLISELFGDEEDSKEIKNSKDEVGEFINRNFNCVQSKKEPVVETY